MRERTKQRLMTGEQTTALLKRAEVGRISTLNENGYPYTVPVQFVYENGRIYIHGATVGLKAENIRRDPRVCFEADEMQGLIFGETACNVNTAYESAVLFGMASFVEDPARKTALLQAILRKYAPQLGEAPLPEKAVAATGIIEIEVGELTGKYYR